MSKYYTVPRTKNLYIPKSKIPFKLSRTGLELFIDCPRCFYLDKVKGIKRPPGFPFNLNSAVDHLLKKEFDIHRIKKTAHPLMKAYGLKAIPFAHEDIDKWRYNFTGVQFLHKPTNLLIYGAVDDVWIGQDKKLIVVDYKSTSVNRSITELDKDYYASYKRQMEIYQWLLKMNKFKVSQKGYFVFCNGKRDKEAFDGKLEFEVTLVPYAGRTNWVEDVILQAKKTLNKKTLPKASKSCDYCAYFEARKKIEK